MGGLTGRQIIQALAYVRERREDQQRALAAQLAQLLGGE